MDTDSSLPVVFKEEVLTANRRGTITDEQLKQIQWPVRVHILLQWILLLALCTGGAYGATYFMLEPDVLMVLLSVALVLIFLMGWMTQSRLGSLKQREVGSVAGPVSRRTITSGKKKPRYEIMVARKKFKVPEEVYNSMHDGDYYRIYYQPKVNLLLTAEQV